MRSEADADRRSTTPARRLLAYTPILVAAAILALVPLRYHESGSMMRVVNDGMLFAAYAVAFNVIFGSTGQLFLCTGALAGVGGFMSAVFADRQNVLAQWPTGRVALAPDAPVLLFVAR